MAPEIALTGAGETKQYDARKHQVRSTCLATVLACGVMSGVVSKSRLSALITHPGTVGLSLRRCDRVFPDTRTPVIAKSYGRRAGYPEISLA
jgi:hypothetical protein